MNVQGRDPREVALEVIDALGKSYQEQGAGVPPVESIAIAQALALVYVGDALRGDQPLGERRA